MIIAFCGHSDYVENKEDEIKIIEMLETKAKEICFDFFLGLYGNFDRFCYSIAKKFKDTHINSKLFFISPYNDETYLKNRALDKGNRFDLIIYPELETVPRKYAIFYRNKWIVEKADLIIAFVKKKYGGAFTMYEYAKKLGKDIYNIAE